MTKPEKIKGLSRKEYFKQYSQRPEVKKHLREKQRIYSQRPEVKKQQRKNQQRYNQNPEVKKHRKEYQKENFTQIPVFGKTKKQTHRVYTNGVTKEITREMVEKIKNKVLSDCIKNPSKYLDDAEKRRGENEKRHTHR